MISLKIYDRLQMKETIESNNLILIEDSNDLDDIKYILGIK